MFKKLPVLLLMIAAVLSLSACSNKYTSGIKETSISTENKISVIVSFNPLKEFAEAVGKDKVQVKTMVPEGSEPHDFEPKPRDMESLMKAHIFVYNGVNMESWVDKTLEAVQNDKLIVVDSSKGANLIKGTYKHEEEEASQYDPHIWLSLKEAKTQALNIKEALVKADENNKEFYEKNYIEFADKLDSLYKEYSEKFSSISNKNFVTGHAAFGYLCRDFGLTQQSVEDVFAEGEPTPQKLKELTEFARDKNIKTIFMESLASPKVSETLAKEIGGKVETIYTIESKEDNKDYYQSMKDNLEKIYNSLR